MLVQATPDAVDDNICPNDPLLLFISYKGPDKYIPAKVDTPLTEIVFPTIFPDKGKNCMLGKLDIPVKLPTKS